MVLAQSTSIKFPLVAAAPALSRNGSTGIFGRADEDEAEEEEEEEKAAARAGKNWMTSASV